MLAASGDKAASCFFFITRAALAPDTECPGCYATNKSLERQ